MPNGPSTETDLDDERATGLTLPTYYGVHDITRFRVDGDVGRDAERNSQQPVRRTTGHDGRRAG